MTLTEPGEYAGAIPSDAAKLVVDANGEVTLSSAAAYRGEVEIRSGSTLKVPNLATLANAPVTVKDGGTFYPTFECTGKSALLQPVTIAGSGNGDIGAFKYGGPQNYKSDSLVGTLILAADATIEC